MEQQMMEELQKRKEEQLREAARREVMISCPCACAQENSGMFLGFWDRRV
jgi:hypothetical protein